MSVNCQNKVVMAIGYLSTTDKNKYVQQQINMRWSLTSQYSSEQALARKAKVPVGARTNTITKSTIFIATQSGKHQRM